jgi:hypothetical protein
MESINHYDFGIMSDLLEAEMSINNIVTEMMREEAVSVLTEDASDRTQAVSQKIKAFIEVIMKLWNSFKLRVKNAVNQVIANNNVAKKFLQKYKFDIDNFKEAPGKMVSVNPVISGNANKLMSEVQKVTRMAEQILSDGKNGQFPGDYQQKLADIEKQIHAATNTINETISHKEKIKLDQTAVRNAVRFLETGYKSMNSNLTRMIQGSESRVTQATREMSNFVNRNNIPKEAVGKILATYQSVVRLAVGAIIRVNAKMMAVANQSYVDCFTICREAVAHDRRNAKNDKRVEKEQTKKEK